MTNYPEKLRIFAETTFARQEEQDILREAADEIESLTEQRDVLRRNYQLAETSIRQLQAALARAEHKAKLTQAAVRKEVVEELLETLRAKT